MAAESKLKVSAGGILDINRDSEVLNRFVRINDDESESVDGDQKDPLKAFVPHKPEPHGIVKSISKKVDFEDKKQEEHERRQNERRDSLASDKQQQKPPSADKEKAKEKISQKQIKDELKKRRKKRKRPRPEEVYTDKDRAAAVNMGTRDIKHSLKIKRQQDRSRVLQIPDEAEPSTFLALGKFEMSKGEPEVALNFMDKALELNPAEKNCLVARSKCYILLGQPENGLNDAEAALAVDKSFIKAIYQKAEALYYLGDFEHSLMYYHRGLRIRPDHEGFQLGVRKAQKAIENAIGGPFPGSKESSAASSTVKSTSRGRSKSSSSTPTSSTKNSPELLMKVTESVASKGTQRTTPAFRPTTVNKGSKLLRELRTDKEYLDNLLNHPDLKCKNKEDDSTIVGYIQEALDFLNSRQEFWRQQLPNACK